MKSYIESRPHLVNKENLVTFNNVAILFLLKTELSKLSPTDRVNAVSKLISAWSNQVDKNITKELAVCTDHTSDGNFDPFFWGVETPEEAIDQATKILSNGKLSALSIIDYTLNGMLMDLEKGQEKNNFNKDETK